MNTKTSINRASTIGTLISVFMLLSSCNKEDKIYEGNSSPNASDTLNTELIDKFKLKEFRVGGVSLLAAIEPQIEQTNFVSEAVLSEMFKTPLTEDREVLDFAWGVVVTHITYKEAKYATKEDLVEDLQKIEKKLTRGKVDSSKTGIYRCGNIEGMSLDVKTDQGGIKLDQSSVIFASGKDFWQVQIIGVGVSEEPNHDLFDKLVDQILGSVKITD